MANLCSQFVQEKYGIEASVSKINYVFPHAFLFEQFLLKDSTGDTLVSVAKGRLDINKTNFKQGIFELDRIKLSKPYVNLHQLPDSIWNYSFLLQPNQNEQEVDTVQRNFTVLLKQIKVLEGKFLYNNVNPRISEVATMDFNHLMVDSINLNANQLLISQDSISAFIQKISLEEQCGFTLQKLSTKLLVNNQKIKLDTMRLHANNSLVQGLLQFEYNKFQDFKAFNKRVSLHADLSNSEILFSDLGYFAPILVDKDLKLVVNGVFKGTIDNLRGRHLQISGPKNIRFKGAVDLLGLPHIDRTFISLRVKEINATRRSLQEVFNKLITDRKVVLPENLKTLGNMQFKGNFDGFINDFVAFGKLKTEIGSINLDMSLTEPKQQNQAYLFDGKLKTIAFDLGKFYDNSKLGTLTANLEVDGKGLTMDKVNAFVNGKVESVEINNYNYKNIKLSGVLAQYLFRGIASIKDPNIVLDFDGAINFENKLPKLNFEASIAHCDLKKINLWKGEDEAFFNAKITVDAIGLKPNDFNGEVELHNLSYCDGKKQYDVDNFNVTATLEEFYRRFLIRSPMMDVNLEGYFNPNNILNVYKTVLSQSAPTYFDSLPEINSKEELTLSARFKNINPIIQFFNPNISVANNTALNTAISNQTNILEWSFSSDSIKYNKRIIQDVDWTIQSINDILNSKCNISSIRLGDSLAFENIYVNTKMFYDNFQVGMTWKNESNYKNSGAIDAVGMLTNGNRLDFDVLPSNIHIGDDHWKLNSSAHITILNNYLRIAGLNLYNGDQHLTVNGTISESNYDKMFVDIKDFGLDNLNPLISASNYFISGNLSGKATLANMYTNPIFDVNANIDHFQLNDYYVGDFDAYSVWDNESKTIRINTGLTKENKKVLELDGVYKPFDKQNALNLNLLLNQFNLQTLKVIENDVVSEIDGHANGNIAINGFFDDLKLDGKLKLKDAHVKVNYLNTKYLINSDITIKPDYFGLNYVPIKDAYGNSAYLVGTVFHEKFKNWNFDLYAEPTKFLALNTTSGDNELYYGKAFITGTVDIYGFANNLSVELNAKTESNTKLFIPLGNTGIAGEQDFVSFVNRNEVQTDIKQEVNLDGVKLDLNIEATPEAELQLIFDEQLGDIIRGKGHGNIRMDINTNGKFNMYGQYVVEEGDYMFTLQKIINKRFDIRQGGTISWYGSPYEADVDLTAVYTARAPLYDVLAEKLESYKNRVPVECLMHLSGNLLKPEIEFDIDFPGLNEGLKNQIKSAMSTSEELNKQVFALLVLNRFLPTANSGDGVRGTNTGTGFGNATTSDVISNQISKWLSQMSKEFDVGFVYRPGDQVSNEELELTLSKQFLNDRLIFSGNFGVSNGNEVNQNPNTLIGDFSIEYSLTDDGRLRLKVFNESNDYDVLNTNQTGSRQGVGVFYQENFDSFGEWMKSIFKGFLKKTK